MGQVRRMLASAVALGVVLALGVAFAPPSGALTTDEQYIFDQVNQFRAQNGLPALQLDPEAQALAEGWAAHMAVNGLGHPTDQYAGITTPVYWVGDTITQAFSPQDAVERFENSQVHRGIITDSRYDYMGVGVATAADGTIYVQIKFMATTASLGLPEQPEEQAPEPTPEDTTAAPEVTEPPPTDEVGVLGEAVTRNVNMAVIPPVRYGALGFPAAESDDASSSPLPAIALAIGLGLLLLLAALLASQAIRRRNATGT